jgi:CRISPR-associated protein Cas2
VAATAYRNFLLKQGFQMAQLSVYFKHCRDSKQADLVTIRISQAVPNDGKLDIVMITDRQYENMVTFYGQTRKHRENPHQLTLF